MAMPEYGRSEQDLSEEFGDPSPLGHDYMKVLVEEPPLADVHDPRLAYALAVLSAWSYADYQSFTRRIRRNGFARCHVDEAAVTNDALFVVSRAYVVRSLCGRAAIIVFRGTEPVNLVSWLTDADVITRQLPKTFAAADTTHEPTGKVHRGFLANLEAVWDDMLVGLAKASGVETLYVAGHSLGGAMAVLAAARLLRMPAYREALRGVYTYGQPAVGDESFAEFGDDLIGDRLFRHIYHHDIVPQLPPASSGTFVHFGTEYRSHGPLTEEVWRKSRTNIRPVQFVLMAALGAVLEFATRRTTWLRWIPFPNSIDDHSPQFYIATSRNSLL